MKKNNMRFPGDSLFVYTDGVPEATNANNEFFGSEGNDKQLTIDATDDNLMKVLAFVDDHLEAVECPPKAKMQIDVAVEEIFVNIAHYAYAPEVGPATIQVELEQDPKSVFITFLDRGTPFDPLAEPDPDVTLPAEERQIGGLGIYMVKKSMDDVRYEYRDGQNILTLVKELGKK